MQIDKKMLMTMQTTFIQSNDLMQIALLTNRNPNVIQHSESRAWMHHG